MASVLYTGKEGITGQSSVAFSWPGAVHSSCTSSSRYIHSLSVYLVLGLRANAPAGQQTSRLAWHDSSAIAGLRLAVLEPSTVQQPFRNFLKLSMTFQLELASLS